MNRRITITSIFIIFALFITAKNTWETDPITLGNKLVDEISIDGVNDVCRFHNLIPLSEQKGDTITFKSGSNWSIKCHFIKRQNNHIPVIEIIMPKISKQEKRLLKEYNYIEKENNNKDIAVYYKGDKTRNRITQCNIYNTTPQRIVFTKIYVP